MSEPPARHPTGTSGPAVPASGPAVSTGRDVDPAAPGQGAGPGRIPWATLGVIAAGGAAGALARHGLVLAFPHPPDGFPWATFAINVSGCLLIGLLMVFVTEARGVHPLLRPFLGVGVLGGFTTFSAYVIDIGRLVAAGAPQVALGYLFGTVTAALAATWTGIALGRLILRAGPGPGPGSGESDGDNDGDGGGDDGAAGER
ncbi:fluoride efflux transporter FluC [Streptosporangium sp. NPDC050855]|uniref:fluoride efflux transporter FluC n=1 Tax=Streptosporangium sp. NPDC050855 TaxID=3366194 RepID=UPI00378F828C